MDHIFSFWSGLSEEEARIHPRDKSVLSRVNNPFEHSCFAEPFRGRLKTAPVVLLFLPPGLHDRDLSASTQEHAYYSRQRDGHCDLPTAYRAVVSVQGPADRTPQSGPEITLRDLFGPFLV
jgi:hypothetical protein